MPPHLHPRSRLTSSLFATTLFASFFVVALPHALPCPAPRVLYADDGTPIPRKRRRRPAVCLNENQSDETTESKDLVKPGVGEVEGDADVESEMEGEGGKRIAKRECPVPKPPGILGEILGFRSCSGEGKNRPP
jgi:cytochrome c oxidase assembly factor 2